MKNHNILVRIKQTLIELIPSKDSRTNISPLDFVVSLIFCYISDSKTPSLESIRREMKSILNQNICKSSFWERLSRQRLKNFLYIVVSGLIVELSNKTLNGIDLLTSLGVIQILLVDSSSISLWDGAKEDFPGTRTTAGIKWHACFDLLSGVMTWFKLTPTSTNDSQRFPELKDIAKKLFIFDLGYWSFDLLQSIDLANGFFLSRLKSNTVIQVKEVVFGMSKIQVGMFLKSIVFKNKRGNVIEFIGEKEHKKEFLNYRVIGFWNPSERVYHWYITNLKVSAFAIYPLYRLRWQIELIFKGCKSSLNANRLTSNQSNIIESLLLASIAAHLVSTTILHVGINQMNDKQKLAISFQRIAKISAILSKNFLLFFINTSKEYLEILINKIFLFSNEIFDPNYKNRNSSLAQLKLALESIK